MNVTCHMQLVNYERVAKCSVRTIFQGKVSFVTARKVTDLKVNLYRLSFEINLKGIMQLLHTFAR